MCGASTGFRTRGDPPPRPPLAEQSERRHRFVGKASATEQNWNGVKPVFAVCSGGLHPGMTSELIKIMGTNIIAQYDGGCHGHPDGTRAGAKAIRQSVDASLKKIPLKTYAKTHIELSKALKKWC